MDRLTTHKNECNREMICRYEDCDVCEEYCPHLQEDNCLCLQEVLEKLGQYEDAEEQGLLLKLPCKVGDYVYQLDRTNKKVITQKVQGITLYMGRKSFSMQIVFETTGMCFHREFGTTVFLNKKEAMQALKEISSRGST